jgi:CHASE2 domain-containing sensor protein
MFKSFRKLWRQGSVWLVHRMGHTAYLWLAAVFSLLVRIDYGTLHLIGTMERRLFDLLVSQRIAAPLPDPDILIVDIDEVTLAAMAPHYGRRPWPNRVFGEFVAGIEKQQPKAIVFDILFSDTDVLRPDSDANFDRAIAESRHTFFPMLRLGQTNGTLRQIRPSMLSGVTPLPGATPEDRPLAIILPQVPAAIANGRLGTHNIVPDRDGVIRRYPFRLTHAGWSLPSRLEQTLAGQRLAIRYRRTAGRRLPHDATGGSPRHDQSQRETSVAPRDRSAGCRISVTGQPHPASDRRSRRGAQRFRGHCPDLLADGTGRRSCRGCAATGNRFVRGASRSGCGKPTGLQSHSGRIPLEPGPRVEN